MATRVFADEELERLREFAEVGREKLLRFFTLPLIRFVALHVHTFAGPLVCPEYGWWSAVVVRLGVLQPRPHRPGADAPLTVSPCRRLVRPECSSDTALTWLVRSCRASAEGWSFGV